MLCSDELGEGGVGLNANRLDADLQSWLLDFSEQMDSSGWPISLREKGDVSMPVDLCAPNAFVAPNACVMTRQ